MANATVKTKLVKIGNSQGVRIPKPLIEQTGLKGAVEMTVRDGELVIKPAVRKRKPREGWRDAFAKMAQRGDDKPLLDFPNKFDEEEWTW